MSLPTVGEKKRSDSILVVDDEAFIREGIELYFATQGYQVSVAANGEEALAYLAANDLPDVAILDILMPGMNGVDLLREVRKRYPDVEVVMASGNGTLQTAVEAMRLGAYDYIAKPILNFEEDLLKVVRKAIERRRLLMTNRRLAQDWQEATHELKTTNSQLRKRVAELEILTESAGLLGEVNRLAALYEVIESILRFHFEIPRALLLLAEPKGWRVACAPGCQPFTGAELVEGMAALPLDTMGPHPQVIASQIPALAAAYRKLTRTEPDGGSFTLFPLRAGGAVIGCLVVLPEEDAKLEERYPLLQLFSGQLAAPIAFLSGKDSP